MYDTSKLPDKLSDMLELAVNDAIAAQKLPHVTLDMGEWLWFEDDGTCGVCLAGAVMLLTVGGFEDNSWVTRDLGGAWQKLDAIDDARGGYIVYSADESLGTKHMPLIVRTGFRDIIKRTYNKEQGRAHWATYRAAIRYLRKHGY